MRPTSPVVTAACLLFLVAAAIPCSAQPSLASVQRPAAGAVKAGVPPVLDGDILNDDAWRNVTPAPGQLVQKNPREGDPGSERTEVRILYTRTALYVGVICFDRAAASGSRNPRVPPVSSAELPAPPGAAAARLLPGLMEP